MIFLFENKIAHDFLKLNMTDPVQFNYLKSSITPKCCFQSYAPCLETSSCHDKQVF